MKNNPAPNPNAVAEMPRSSFIRPFLYVGVRCLGARSLRSHDSSLNLR